MLQEIPLFQCTTLLPSASPNSVSLPRTIRCSSSPAASVQVSFALPAGSAASGDLSAKERRQLRKERRERNAAVSGNWREEVEEKLARRRKKDYASWKEKLNLDNLAKLGPQWWAVRVARVNGHETADSLARALARGFPGTEFKVYYPTVREKKKLRNGSFSEKLKPLYPGCVFLHCVLNKEIHDYVRECDRVGGFLGSKVGTVIRQINKPKPVAAEDIEAILKLAEEQQQDLDLSFEKEMQELGISSTIVSGSIKSKTAAKVKRLSPKKLESSGDISFSGVKVESLAPGATIRILSGPFSDFTGCVKDLDKKNGKATVGLMLLGKEISVDLEFEQISAQT